MKNSIGIKALSFFIAGAMAVGTVGASVSLDTAIVAEASDSDIVFKIITDDLRAFAPFCPQLGVVGAFIGNIAAIAGGDGSAAALKQINDNINSLRKEMHEEYAALNSKMDTNTRKIVDAIGNKLVINDAGVRLNDLAQTVDGISDQIDIDVNSSRKSYEQKCIAVAKQIMNYQKWNDRSNLISMIGTVGDLLSGKTFAELGSRDIYTSVYLDCCQNVMFSGEAYDLAEPYIDRVMYEYYHAYTVAMQCLKAVKDVANFTDEQKASLSAQDYKDLLDLAADADQAEARMDKLTKQLFDLDDPGSVAYHFLVFKYKKLHERNVFVNKGTMNVPISPDVAELTIKADVKGDDNTYRYTTYQSNIKSAADKIKEQINNGIAQSAIDPDNMKQLYEYVKSAYPDKSFDEYLETVSISTDSYKDSSNAYFPISELVNDGKELAHYPRQEPNCPRSSQCSSEDAWHKYWNIGMTSFDHADKDTQTKNIRFYGIKTWYILEPFTSNYGFRPEKQNNNMLVLQKADPLEIAAKGSDIVAQLRAEGVYDYTLHWSTADTWRYSVGERAFKNNRLSVYDHFGNQVNVNCVFEARETPEDGIDIAGSTATRMVINAPKPGEYHLRWRYTNAFGDNFYSKWITFAAFDPDGRITADASGWSKKVVLGVYDLDKLVKVSILGTNGLAVNDPYTWEAKEPCIKISGHQMTVHDFGTFHIRAKTVNANGKEICSDWVTFESDSGAPDGFNVHPYLTYYEKDFAVSKETPINVSTDIDSLFKMRIVYEAGAWVLEDPLKPIWELKELPEKGCCIKSNKYFYASQPGVYHVRAVSYDYNIVTDWFEIRAVSYGDDDGEPESFDYDASFVRADENTSFVIRQSYTGLVGAEPDSIEQPSAAEQSDSINAEADYPSHKRLMVDAIDGISGREIRVQYTWEAQETDGISLTEDGKVTFSKAGTYHVRVNSGEYSSDWFEISAVTESKEYATIAFCDEDNTLIQNITLPWGTKITPPADPVKEGYTFAGWSQAIPERMPADDMSIYAVWTKNGEPAESKPDDTEPPESKPDGSEPAESKPVDTKPANSSSNPNTGKAAAGALALAAAAVGAMIVIKKREH